MNHVTEEMIEQKLVRNLYRLRKGYPIGLHADPRCKLIGFCAIGQVNWGGQDDPPSLGDVYVGKKCQHYRKINRMLRNACENLGLPFINMD